MVNPAIWQAQDARRDQGVDHRAIAAHVTLFEFVGVDFTGHRALEQDEVGGAIVGMGEIQPVLADQLLAATTKQLAKRLIDLQPASVGRGRRDADRRVVENTAEQLLALA